jgi:SAM-dependent methyltransferase
VSAPEERPSCCFDEWAACTAKRARKKGTAAPVTATMVEALAAAGLEGRSVLDAGCGPGDLALATLARGASRATGFDLGSGAIELAVGLARERGVSDRARFEVGDASTSALPRSDVVVLNRVICCYPDATDLVANTLTATGDVYAYSAPVHRGLVGSFNRLVTWVSNGWYALRRRKYRGFRVFVHDLDDIDATVRRAGFTPIHRQRRRVVWDLAVYRRDR